MKPLPGQRLNNRIIVVGGSIGGLFAANLLHRSGWDVHVFERASEDLQGRGAGIVTHPELIDALAQAGITVTENFGVKVQTRVTVGRDGSIVGSRDAPQVLTAWNRVYRLLRGAFPNERYHNNKHLTEFAQDESGVQVEFADGEVVQADVLIGADGLRSPIRQAILPEVVPKYAGYVAWRGMVEEAALSERVLTDIFPYFAFDLPPKEQMLAYPIAGLKNSNKPGRRRYNFVWYRPVDERELLNMMRDDHGKVWPEGIPPPLIRPAVIKAARQAAFDVLSPQFAEVVDKTESLFFQPIFDLESHQIAFDRIAILGDAAFVARPHCAMGVTKAGGDAIALTNALNNHKNIEKALLVFEKERMKVGGAIVDHARALGAYMQAQISTPAQRKRAEMYRTPEAVMRETAYPPAAHL